MKGAYMNQKLLILESHWSVRKKERITDGRSTGIIYKTALQSLMSTTKQPYSILTRPLLASTFADDIEQFVNLPSNRKGMNVIIISGHGDIMFESYDEDFGEMKKCVQAYDEKVSTTCFEELYADLTRSIVIFDACDIGTEVNRLQFYSNALMVIGFAKAVAWCDSTLFVLSLLMEFHFRKVFQSKRINRYTPLFILNTMRAGRYKSLIKSLKVRWKFNK